tara:strand:- start:280 stop:600 length:321 start_codon:yes stop_codon:yes gene_type:complete
MVFATGSTSPMGQTSSFTSNPRMRFIFGSMGNSWQFCQLETSQVLIIMTKRNSEPSSAKPLSEATGKRLADAFEELQKLWLGGPLPPAEAVRGDRAKQFIEKLNDK